MGKFKARYTPHEAGSAGNFANLYDDGKIIDSSKILTSDPNIAYSPAKERQMMDDFNKEETNLRNNLLDRIQGKLISALDTIKFREKCDKERKKILSILDIDYQHPETQQFVYYKPVDGKRTFRGKVVLSEDINNKEVRILVDRVFNEQGKRVIQKRGNTLNKEISLNAEKFEQGVYNAHKFHKDNLCKPVKPVVIKKTKTISLSDQNSDQKVA